MTRLGLVVNIDFITLKCWKPGGVKRWKLEWATQLILKASCQFDLMNRSLVKVKSPFCLSTCTELSIESPEHINGILPVGK